jgi:Na+/H+ antiporter NhaD/arsenite permease-like protein
MFSDTGVFGWLAYRAFRLARGNAWLLGMVLVLLTGVTAILLLVPLSIEISTIVGSHLGMSFVGYLVNMAPIAILCMIPLLILTSLLYRREFAGASERVSPALVAQLEADARITDAPLLRKALVVGTGTMVLFFVGDQFGGMPPSVIALTGAVSLIAWVRPDMHRMLREVDWTTLVFFIGIFIVVGALEASGVIEWVAGTLPIADHLTATIPGAENGVLYWALILGADLGGNSTYLGSAPNMVAVGLLAQAGYRISFGRFMRDGVPVAIATLVLATIWLLIRY